MIASFGLCFSYFAPVLSYSQDQNNTNPPKWRKHNLFNSLSMYMIKELYNKVELTLWERDTLLYYIDGK